MTGEFATALDKVLENLVAGVFTSKDALAEKLGIEVANLEPLLQLLHAEKYIGYFAYDFTITDKGFAFRENGGYRQKYLRDTVDIQKQTITELTEAHLKLQNEYLPYAIRQAKRKRLTDLFIFLGGAAVTFGATWLSDTLSETREQKKQPSELKIVVSPTNTDTTIIIYSDTLQKDSLP